MGVVLVHGAFVNGSAWDSVAEPLRLAGHRVEVLELHRGSLMADTRAAQGAVDAIGGPVVACGWSYGGMVITGLELPQNSHLVYLCALMPDEGESMMALGLRYSGGVDTILGANEAGDLIVEGDAIDEVFWGDAPPDVAERARSSIRPQSLASFMEAPTRIVWKDHPSTYVRGRFEATFHPSLVDEMAARASTVTEWDTSHSPVLSRPDLVVELLRTLDPATG